MQTDAPGEEALRLLILKAVISGLVDIHVFEPELAERVSERPEASPVARRLAETGPVVANLRHRLVHLTELDRLVLPYLDGRNDRSEILDGVEVAASRMETPLLGPDGQPATEAEALRAVLPAAVDKSLRRLLRSALLIR